MKSATSITCNNEIEIGGGSTNDAVSIYLHSDTDLTLNTNCNILSRNVDSTNDELEIRGAENLQISSVIDIVGTILLQGAIGKTSNQCTFSGTPTITLKNLIQSSGTIILEGGGDVSLTGNMTSTGSSITIEEVCTSAGGPSLGLGTTLSKHHQP